MKVKCGEVEVFGKAVLQKYMLEPSPGQWEIEGRMFLRSQSEAVAPGMYTVNPADCLASEQLVVPGNQPGRVRSQSMIVFRLRPEHLVPVKAVQPAKVG